MSEQCVVGYEVQPVGYAYPQKEVANGCKHAEEDEVAWGRGYSVFRPLPRPFPSDMKMGRGDKGKRRKSFLPSPYLLFPSSPLP